MYNTILAEAMSKPTVALCHEGFLTDARSAAAIKGMPGLRIVPETVPSGSPWISAMDEVEAGVSAAIDPIVDALTRPLTDEEQSPKPKGASTLSRTVFKGSLQELNQFFYRRGWTDGWPIMPPTEEAVAEMLTGTDFPPDHVVAELIPRGGIATVEKIAINAVMAGALPTHMPVLIAAVEALVDPRGWFGTYEVSTGSWAPCWIVNGPIRKQLHITSGTGALSPGDIANAAIGRAMSLIIKNIGGARKGIEDMGVLGNPGKYTMLIGENEEETPWEPLHVQEGFSKEDNAISVFYPNTSTYVFPFASDARGILDGIIANILPGRRGLFCLMLIPAHAHTLASAGWSKEDVRGYIVEYARVPAYRHPEFRPTREVGRNAPKQWSPSNPEDSMAILSSPDWMRIVVAGGPGAFMGLLQAGGYAFGNSFVTKRIQLPATWEKLVRKYDQKYGEPAYARY